MADDDNSPITRIVKAVCDLLAEEGVTNLSMRNVAGKAGATIGLITHHFPNRAAMVRAAVEATWLKELEIVRWPQTPDKAAVLKSVEIFLPLDEERRRQLSVWLAFWALTQTSAELQAIHKRVHLFIQEKHAHWIRQLGFARGDAVLYADRLALLSDSVLLYALLDPEYWSPRRQRSTIRTLIDDIFAEAGRRAYAASSK